MRPIGHVPPWTSGSASATEIRSGAYSQAAVALANDSVASVDQLDDALRRRERRRALVDRPPLRRRALLQPPAARARDRHADRQRLHRGHEFPGAGPAGADRGDPARRPGAAGERGGRGAAGERRRRGWRSRAQAPRREIVARPRDAVAWALYYPPILSPLAERARSRRPCPRACNVPWSGSRPTTMPARWRRSMPCPTPRATPLPHLPRGRAAQRRPGR